MKKRGRWCRQQWSSTWLELRFWPRVRKTEGCWPWTGPLNDGGYGATGYGLVHIIAWTARHGEVPEGLKVCHTCDNRACCKDEHHFIGTQKQNMHDAIAKGRWIPREIGGNYRKTHCPQGHAYDDKNTRVKMNGWRDCRVCHKLSERHMRRVRRLEWETVIRWALSGKPEPEQYAGD